MRNRDLLSDCDGGGVYAKQQSSSNIKAASVLYRCVEIGKVIRKSNVKTSFSSHDEVPGSS